MHFERMEDEADEEGFEELQWRMCVSIGSFVPRVYSMCFVLSSSGHSSCGTMKLLKGNIMSLYTILLFLCSQFIPLVLCSQQNASDTGVYIKNIFCNKYAQFDLVLFHK